MPIYMDRHDIPEVSAEAAALAHLEDLKIQEHYGCQCMTYWVDEERGNAFCLIEAPDKQSVKDMHDNAHGLIPHEIIKVDARVVQAFLGRIQDPTASHDKKANELTVFNDPAFRALLVVRIGNAALLKDPEVEKIKEAIDWAYKQILDSLKQYRGRLVEEKGSDFLASFPSVTNAVNAALDIQQKLRSKFDADDLQKVDLKIGLNAGIPVHKNEQIFGDTITTARRLSSLSRTGIIHASPIIGELYKSASFTHDAKKIRLLNVAEESFLKRLFDQIEQSLLSQDYSVESLSKSLAVSKSQLYRKIKDLSGMSPNDLMKEVRLFRALDLLRTGESNISVVSYQLGFSSPSYFSRCFKQRFGISPGRMLND